MAHPIVRVQYSIPAEILNLPPGLGDDLGLVGVDGDAHAAQ